MIENVQRKIVLIVALLLGSVLLMVLPEEPVRYGLDLKGGTRYVFKLDFEGAEEAGQLTGAENRAQLLEDTKEIIRQRIDPKGIYEPVIRGLGTDRIEVAVPSQAIPVIKAESSVESAVAATGVAPIRIAETADLENFPGAGGVVRIGNELIRYDRRVGTELQGVRRSWEDTPPEAHAPGDDVILVSTDAVINAISNIGALQFYIAAQAADFTAAGTDEASARTAAETWANRPENKGVGFSAYNVLPFEQGGPPPGIRFFPRALEDAAEEVPVGQLLVALRVPPEKWVFTGEDLAAVQISQDRAGYPAVNFEMTPGARIPFGNFTGEHKDQLMAIVLNDEIVSLANIMDALIGSAIIQGRFTQSQVESMVRVLRSGSLKIKPELEAQERVGATLGQEYVRRGFFSALLGLGAVLAFMMFYYRRLGVFAAVALIANLMMIAGAMAGLQATLTLPGIAGIILTVGMAVDANILIFDRIREEADKGHKVLQAAKNGFQNATSAIIDANVTTLITALILMNVGTGPVRGFAVTLSIGILTSVFSALVITRVLVHLQLEKKVPSFQVGSWLAKANFDFASKWKMALTASVIATIGGVIFFIALPDTQKLGIDFLGGASVKVRTEVPETTERVRELVAGIPGNIGQSASVAPLPASQTDDGYREFQVTFKTDPDATGTDTTQATLESEIRSGLAEILQRGPVEVTLNGDQIQATLYFERGHAPADVSRVIADGGHILNPSSTPRDDQRDVHVVTGTVRSGAQARTLTEQLQIDFGGKTDSTGNLFALAQPVPETTVVGGQVVGELRDSAIKAILLSLFAVVLYIRVRFAEYSYGFAAVCAVVHDVVIVMGAMALADVTGLASTELNLPMIAAFLTIVGYSLNDTIVIFDRVRENLPRVKGSLREVVNLSINQTLSRTIMTSITTLLTLVMLFLFSYGTGSVLEGFSFAMIVGLISGTYSTIFIATPVFVWLETRAQNKAGATADASKKTAATATS